MEDFYFYNGCLACQCHVEGRLAESLTVITWAGSALGTRTRTENLGRRRWGNFGTLSIFRYAPLTYALLSEFAMQVYCY
jgi:hypothetical protein